MIFLGSDHAGFNLKEEIKKLLKELGMEYRDLGTYSPDPTDYPDYAEKVGSEVVRTGGKGILICGTGTGMVIAANKIRGVRATPVWDEYTARKSREDNDANVMTLPGRDMDPESAKKLVKIWLETPFSGLERHRKRIEKIKLLEEKNYGGAGQHPPRKAEGEG